MPTDDELITEILEGRKASADVLIRRYYKTVFAIVYRRIGDYHLSCDVTQEIFVKMIRTLGTCRDRTRFRAWLLRITVNCCMDYYRSAMFKNACRTDEIRPDIPDVNTNVSSLLERKVERSKVREALKSLPDAQQEALILSYYEDLKIREIAEVTGVNASTVKTRIRQGIRKLQKILERGEACEQGFRR